MTDNRGNLYLRILGLVKNQPAMPKPTPRHRISGPRERPADWYDKPEMVLPQCALCHGRPLPGSMPLRRGLCGPCWDRTTEADDAA